MVIRIKSARTKIPTPPLATDRIQIAFEKFHADNPHVFMFFEERCAEAWQVGIRRMGMNLLLELFRWHGMMETRSSDGYRINQNYAPRYARRILEVHPEWDGLFELRALRSAGSVDEAS